MARVNSRSSFFPCSETKQKSLLRRLMRHEMHNYFFFFGRWAIWCQLSNYDHRYQLRSLHGDYFLLGCPLGQRSIKKYLLFMSKKDQMVGTEFLENCSCPSFPGADFCGEGTPHFRSSGEQTWKSIWNEHKIILWSYWPYFFGCAELLSKYSIRWCNQPARELQKQCPPTVPTGKALTYVAIFSLLVKSLSLQERDKQYAICKSPRQNSLEQLDEL